MDLKERIIVNMELLRVKQDLTSILLFIEDDSLITKEKLKEELISIIKDIPEWKYQ